MDWNTIELKTIICPNCEMPVIVVALGFDEDNDLVLQFICLQCRGGGRMGIHPRGLGFNWSRGKGMNDGYL